MKIYDCFLFFNELDILELRLELLNKHVDYFVISECDSTFSGKDKPFIFEQNIKRYEKYIDKIIYIKNVDSKNINLYQNNYSGNRRKIYEDILSNYGKIRYTPETDHGKDYWCRDYLHREFVKLGMDNCQEDDIIIFSDIDEIPNPHTLRLDGNSYVFEQRNMMYTLTKENITDVWYGTTVDVFSNIKDISLCEFRRKRMKNTMIKNGGWHLSFMGGKEKIKNKIQSYGHQEFNNPYVMNSVDNNVSNNKDVFGRNIVIQERNLEDVYPEDMIKILKEKCQGLMYV